jgi:hypothetical protein
MFSDLPRDAGIEDAVDGHPVSYYLPTGWEP